MLLAYGSALSSINELGFYLWTTGLKPAYTLWHWLAPGKLSLLVFLLLISLVRLSILQLEESFASMKVR